jgi:hypothetical protein
MVEYRPSSRKRPGLARALAFIRWIPVAAAKQSLESHDNCKLAWNRETVTSTAQRMHAAQLFLTTRAPIHRQPLLEMREEDSPTQPNEGYATAAPDPSLVSSRARAGAAIAARGDKNGYHGVVPYLTVGAVRYVVDNLYFDVAHEVNLVRLDCSSFALLLDNDPSLLEGARSPSRSQPTPETPNAPVII